MRASFAIEGFEPPHADIKNQCLTRLGYIVTIDRDRTVSRRSEPSSCTVLMTEHVNPWKLFQLQDTISRHRGAHPTHNIGDSREVVTPFMHVKNYLTRNFATFGPSWLQPPFTGTSIQNFHFSFSSCQHRAVATLSFLWPKNKILTLFKALLIPKLRSHFAEFLQYYSLYTLIYSIN
eukprot:gene359-454_t